MTSTDLTAHLYSAMWKAGGKWSWDDAKRLAAALAADGPVIVDDGTVTQVERVPRMGAEADGSVTRNLTKNEYPPDTRPLYVPKEVDDE